MDTNSVLSKIDPRFKIITTFAFIIITFMTTSWIMLTVLFAMIILFMLLARLSFIYGLKKLKQPAIMVVVMTILQLLIPQHGTVLIQVGYIRLTEEAIFQGLLIFTRLMLVIAAMLILTMTTLPQESLLAVESFLQPVKKIGIQSDVIIFMFRIIQRFVPTLSQEAHKILKAQASRGLDIKNVNLLIKIKGIGALLLPIFVISIKRADVLSNSMAVRGYVMNRERTNLRSLKGNK